MKTNLHFLLYLANFISELEMFQTKVVDKIKIHILCPITFSRKSRRLWGIVEIIEPGRPRDNVTHAHFTLDTKGYKHTLRVFNIRRSVHRNIFL